jgi:C-terminal processing protease CtpA/Prc
MLRWHFFILAGIALSAHAQTVTRQNLAASLGFENNTRAGVAPAGWFASPANTAFVDDTVFHSGKYSARLERTASSGGTFSNISISLPIDFQGRTIEWRGFLKTENVTEHASLYMSEVGDSASVAFATMQPLRINGTRDWEEFSINVPVHPAGRSISFGFLLGGTGKAWVDDLQLLVDGKPIGDLKTVLDTDQEFDAGSRISLTSLSEEQIHNLATLAKVWGFLKYHHPAVTGGEHHWDYSLFRVMPRILGASSTAAAQRVLGDWIGSLGPVEPCAPCAQLDPSRLFVAPNLSWISDSGLLGAELSESLLRIHSNRRVAARQFFVSLVPSVANPQFDNEPLYTAVRFPDAGFQLLALFRFWNMVEYFSPNRDIMSDDPANEPDYWERVLREFIPRVGLASTPLSYRQEMMRFITKINDTHSNLWGSLTSRPPIGDCYLPVDVRFVEDRAFVIRHKSPSAGPASGFLPGDLIDELDGTAINDLVKEWTPIYAASNQPTRLRDIGNYMTRGACGETSAVVRRGNELVRLRPSRVPTGTLDFSRTSVHDLPGDAFQKLTDDVAYLKLSSVRVAESARYIQAAQGTKGLIIDIRNYPSEFVVFSLGQLLVSERQEFVRFTRGDVTNPGAFHWDAPLALVPQQPRYTGKVVILIDEVTQSQAEYTTMAFRTSPGAIVIGSTTAGADGNVSTVPLPGGLSSYISGIGVFYPDNRPTQRIGIIPDIEVKPTIEAMRAGRDELIEEAIRQIMKE